MLPILLILSTIGQVQSEPEWAADRRAATVKIVCQCRDGSRSLGTGSFVGENYVVTAEHVISDCVGFHITDVQHKPIANGQRIVRATKNQGDLALLQLDRALNVPPIPIAQSDVKPGDEVFFAGFIHGQQFRIHRGIVRTNAADEPSWFAVGGSYQGESGGPVLNAAGELIGAISRSDQEIQRRGPAETIFASANATARFCADVVRYPCPPQQRPPSGMVPIQPPQVAPQPSPTQPQTPCVVIDYGKLAEQLGKDEKFVIGLAGHIKAEKGEPGPQGPKGDKGDQGDQGPKGDQGDNAKFSDEQIASIVAMAAEMASKKSAGIVDISLNQNNQLSVKHGNGRQDLIDLPKQDKSGGPIYFDLQKRN